MNDLDFLGFLNDRITRVEEKMLSEVDQYHPDLGAAMGHLLAAGGKRIRPKVALLMGSMMNADEEQLVSLAAAIEMLHTATLVHDDLIDGALLRRGNPTLNSNWSPAGTVLTGDFIFARAALFAAEVGSTAVTRLFAETLSTIVNGEITQLFNRQQIPQKEAYYRRIYEKTGSMFVLATKASAILGSAKPTLESAAEAYGREIGKAFQIVDDVLDFTGDPSRVGKPIGSDLRQGLVTLPVLYYLEKYPGDEDLSGILEGVITSSRIEQIVGKINQSEVIKQAVDEAVRCSEKAVSLLDGFPSGEDKEALIKLSRYIVSRDL